MTDNDNSVNIQSEGGSYHHGDLRAALIEEGLKCVDAGPPDALSLRQIARNVGVSATAVYRHFPDKAALMGALCQEGETLLVKDFEAAMAAESDRLAAFNAMGRAYVGFALKHPSLFRMMMSLSPQAPDKFPESREGMGLLVQAIEGLFGADLPRQQREAKRLKAWSLVHGLAMLMLDGQVPQDPGLIAAVVDASMI